jgi:hypothetical protein
MALYSIPWILFVADVELFVDGGSEVRLSSHQALKTIKWRDWHLAMRVGRDARPSIEIVGNLYRRNGTPSLLELLRIPE